MSPVYIPPSRESIYAALFAKLSSAMLGGVPAFLTMGRELQSQEQLNTCEKPAMFMVQIDEEWKQNISGLPYVANCKLEVYIFGAQPDTSQSAAPQLNNLVDAALAAMAPGPPPGSKQTLGGLVENVVLRGKCEYYFGLKGFVNAFALFPIEIVAPNLQQGLG